MSSYETRENRDGSTSHRVRFRYKGRNKAVPFVTEAKAKSWQTILDTVGPDRALELLEDPKATALPRTVAEQIEHHIDHLTGIEEGTRAKYRRIAKARLD